MTVLCFSLLPAFSPDLFLRPGNHRDFEAIPSFLHPSPPLPRSFNPILHSFRKSFLVADGFSQPCPLPRGAFFQQRPHFLQNFPPPVTHASPRLPCTADEGCWFLLISKFICTIEPTFLRFFFPTSFFSALLFESSRVCPQSLTMCGFFMTSSNSQAVFSFFC